MTHLRINLKTILVNLGPGSLHYITSYVEWPKYKTAKPLL